MADLQLPNGDKFEKNAAGQAIVWLPIGVKISLAFVGADIEKPLDPRDPDNRSVVSASPHKVVVSDVYKAFRGLTFTLTATAPGTVDVTCRDRSGNVRGSLVAVAGVIKNHPGMHKDLLADICNGSDAGKTLAVQRLLFSRSNNIFDQLNEANKKKFGDRGCGKVVNASGKDLFGSMSPISYEQPYHGSLKAVRKRSDVRYEASTIFQVRMAIYGLLSKGIPVRVGVLDDPIGMHVQNGKLIAYNYGGHTTLIVGCDRSATNFLYIDPWPGGSNLNYGDGITKVSEQCEYMGIFTAQSDSSRLVGDDKAGAINIIRQDRATEGTFKTADDSFLEVVSGPMLPKAIPRLPWW
jgi:hypothetical protein